MIAKTDTEKVQLHTEKMKWRREMRAKFGPNWSKRQASRMTSSGNRQMNA